MVKIRFARFGRKNVPYYRLVAVQAKTKRNGVVIEELGTYDPKLEKDKLVIKKDRVEYWLSVGAQPTDTAHYLLAKMGLVKPPKKKYKKAPGKNKSAKLEAEKTKTETKKEEPKAEETKVDEKTEEAKVEEPKTEEAPEVKTEEAEVKETASEAPAEEAPVETSETK